jgi:hypothetical protein
VWPHTWGSPFLASTCGVLTAYSRSNARIFGTDLPSSTCLIASLL